MATMKQVVFPVRKEAHVHEAPAPKCPVGGCLAEGRFSIISPGTELGILTGEHASVKANLAWSATPYKPGSAWVGQVTESQSNAVPVGTYVLLQKPHGTHATFTPGKDFYLPLREDEAKLGGLLTLATVSLVAMDRCPVTAGDRVLVAGLGVHGNLAAQLFLTTGVPVLGLDTDPHRVELAGQCGLKATVADKHRPIDAVKVDGGAPTLIVDAAGQGPSTAHVLSTSPPLSRVAVVGSPGEASMNVYMGLFRRCLTVIGCHANYYGLTTKDMSGQADIPAAQRVLELWRGGKLTLEPLVGATLPLAQIDEAYAAISKHGFAGLTVALDCRP